MYNSKMKRYDCSKSEKVGIDSNDCVLSAKFVRVQKAKLVDNCMVAVSNHVLQKLDWLVFLVMFASFMTFHD